VYRNHIKYKVEILWQGNPLATVKTFGTSACKPCAKERLAILKLTRSTPHLAINKCNEINGACRHNPGFHRFDIKEENNTVSTDEAMNAERVTHLNPSTQQHHSAILFLESSTKSLRNRNTSTQWRTLSTMV
jgi:hypothetical protein